LLPQPFPLLATPLPLPLPLLALALLLPLPSWLLLAQPLPLLALALALPLPLFLLLELEPESDPDQEPDPESEPDPELEPDPEPEAPLAGFHVAQAASASPVTLAATYMMDLLTVVVPGMVDVMVLVDVTVFPAVHPAGILVTGAPVVLIVSQSTH